MHTSPTTQFRSVLVALNFFAVSSTISFGGPLSLKETVSSPSDFPIVANGRAAEILVDKADAEVVRIAAGLLASDIERVSGVKPGVGGTITGRTAPVIILGTLEKSALIADLIKRRKFDPKSIKGKWESFIVTTVDAPFPGVPAALVIAGSDRRGAAYGALTLSETIGVSPWEWWADVAPQKRENLVVSAVAHTEGSPSVQYRGIFINDEDWGIQPWAAGTFEPASKNIGPKTYAKVCELLLRLKANYLWPAMHKCSKAFNCFPENKAVADRYAIVMGSSHCEPLLRNNVGEWDPKTRGEWNYQKNGAQVLSYWEERVKESGRYENTYTLGMRGVHDGAMPFEGTTPERIAMLQKIISDQRELLAKYVNPKLDQVPQIFIPYKEVLTVYQKGLKVPQDVTLVWPDDNHGYIRRLSTPEEQKRSGGSGVYYHLSYYGSPEDYLWLCTTPPALIWEEMRKAYDHGARKLWIVNVGDIKPAEVGMEFFLRMAWNVDAWNENAQTTFLEEWARRTFGKEHAAEIAWVMDEYYRLNYTAKPEHLLNAQFSTNYDEIAQRLHRFAALVAKTDALHSQLRPEQRDAFFELVAYPVRGSALMNEKHLEPGMAREAYEKIQAETKVYNEVIHGGKWNRMMSAAPRNRQVFLPATAKNPPVSGSVPVIDNAAAGATEPGYISMEAEHPTRAIGGDGVAWKTISGLGRSGDSIALLPTTETVPQNSVLEFDFTAPKAGIAKVLIYAIPTHALHSGLQLRYSVAIDHEPPRMVDLETAESSPAWSANVLRAAAIGTTEHSINQGKHTLKIHPLDPGLVFDKVVLDFGGLKPTHLGPPATHSESRFPQP